MIRRVTIYIDGASRGNPGPAGVGVVMVDEQGRTLREAGHFLGNRTNNEAEYFALLLALEIAEEEGCREISMRTDSELLARQMNGSYRVKSPRLAPLHRRARELAASFARVEFQWINREENSHADRLANRAIDEEAEISY